MNYTVRPCQNLGELSACVALQKAIWGYAEQELYPLRLFVNLNKIGGHTLGAFTPRGELVGFVASMPAWHSRRRYFHSLSLGVLPAHENRGLGRALKLAQREAALRAGLDCIEWTFDPLRAKNAFFNIVRLGAIARRYLPDHYGHVQSRLQQGLPSDRLLAEWWLKSSRVRRAVAGKPPTPLTRKKVVRVSIPKDFNGSVDVSFGKAKAVQSSLRERLQGLFAKRFAITGFIQEGEKPEYVLTRYED